jgi:hypothetical protein
MNHFYLGRIRRRFDSSSHICCDRSMCQYPYDQWCKQRLHRTTERLKVRYPRFMRMSTSADDRIIYICICYFRGFPHGNQVFVKLMGNHSIQKLSSFMLLYP